jgi:hypothetical protein
VGSALGLDHGRNSLQADSFDPAKRFIHGGTLEENPSYRGRAKQAGHSAE